MTDIATFESARLLFRHRFAFVDGFESRIQMHMT